MTKHFLKVTGQNYKMSIIFDYFLKKKKKDIFLIYRVSEQFLTINDWLNKF